MSHICTAKVLITLLTAFKAYIMLMAKSISHFGMNTYLCQGDYFYTKSVHIGLTITSNQTINLVRMI